MKLLLVSDDGQIIDSTDDFTREDWDNLSPVGAKAILDDLNADAR
jgi:hypothetical protein